MTTYTMTLTEDQAQILGFALNTAKNAQRDHLAQIAGFPDVADGVRARIHRIEELRDLLDACPVSP